MASIAIFVDSMHYGTGGTLAVIGTTFVEGGADSPVPFEAYVAFDALPAVQHAAIIDAAVTAVEAETEFEVDALDTKTVYGGPSGL